MNDTLLVKTQELEDTANKIETTVESVKERLDIVLKAYRELLDPSVWQEEATAELRQQIDDMERVVNKMIDDANVVVDTIKAKARENREEEERFNQQVKNAQQV